MGNNCLYQKKEVKNERNLQYETKVSHFGIITQKTVYLHNNDQKTLFRRSLHFK